MTIPALIAFFTGQVAGAVILSLLGLAMVGLIRATRYRSEPTQRATTATSDSG